MSPKHLLKNAIRTAATIAMRLRRSSMPERILTEYRRGRFPMTGEYGFVEWRAPDRRAVIPLDDRFRIGKRLQKKLDSGTFRVSFDTAFAEVLQACAEPTARRGDAWLSPELARAYLRLHEQGHAHSVEVWNGDRLVGGEYGVAIGGFYSGESAFTREDYASRVAMVHLVGRLRDRGFLLIDSQVMNPLAREFGAFELSRDEYAGHLAEALARNVSFR
jgi:leucyl/phenylalanyl-tRNA--protein transferase